MATVKITSFFDLPQDVMFQVFSYLDYQDLARTTLVCKTFSEYSNYQPFWKAQFKKYWDENRVPEKHTTWQEMFKEEYADKGKYIKFYKKVSGAWATIKRVLGEINRDYLKTLGDSVSEKQLADLETMYGVELPSDLRCIYRFHDGQERYEAIDSMYLGLFGTIKFYDYYRDEIMFPLSHIFSPRESHQRLDLSWGVKVIGSDQFSVYCLLQDNEKVRAGTLVTKCPPKVNSYHILANSYLEYFLDYADRLERNYFPVVEDRIFRFFKDPSSIAISHDVKVEVSVAFIPEYSNLQFVHAYLVQFSMDETVPHRMSCQLKARHWEILENGKKSVVDGEGVIGLFPFFKPGTKFSYISGTNFKATSGSMKGHYIVRNLKTDEEYQVTIPEFHMVVEDIVELANLP